MNEPIYTNDDDFQTILICAVRYAIGRATYMPGLVTDWIMANCRGRLTVRTLEVMARDIDNAPSLGWECDAITWRRFREWIREERGKLP